MATFKCPDCGSKVSTSADKCPKCGRPVMEEDRKPKSKKMTWKQMILYTLIAVCIMLYYAGTQVSKTAETNKLKQSYTAVTVDKQKMQASVNKYIQSTLMNEVKRKCQKAGMKAPKGIDIKWTECSPSSYEVLLYFNDGIPADSVEPVARMAVGKISDVLLHDFKVPTAQFKVENTYISVYVFSEILGNAAVNGGVLWHLGEEGALPFFVPPSDVKKYLNL